MPGAELKTLAPAGRLTTGTAAGRLEKLGGGEDSGGEPDAAAGIDRAAAAVARRRTRPLSCSWVKKKHENENKTQN
jgi:hypothetical protein